MLDDSKALIDAALEEFREEGMSDAEIFAELRIVLPAIARQTRDSDLIEKAFNRDFLVGLIDGEDGADDA